MAITAMNAQTIFSTNFSSWNAGALTDMAGAKTNIGAANILQISTGATYGTDLVQLVNATNSHKRFTTLAQAVKEDTTYHIEVYAKGKGDLRMSLFDGDMDGADGGYQAYGPYISINSNTTAMYTQSFTSDTTTTLAEFIVSLRNTDPTMDHIQIDSMIVKIGAYVPPAGKTIREIQSSVDASGLSTYTGSSVITGGIVTAIYTHSLYGGYHIQNGNGAWSGIFIEDLTNVPAIGDSVTLSGRVEESFGYTQITDIEDYVRVSEFNIIYPTIVTTLDAGSEMYESVLCKVINANCQTLPNTYKEWEVNDGSGAILTHDRFFEYPSVQIGTAYNITGIINYSYSKWSINPRDGNDVSVYAGTPISVEENYAVLTNVYPNPTTSGNVTVEVSENASLIVLDLLGNVVVSNEVRTGTNNIDISKLAAGNYILKVGTSVQKLMVK